MKSKWIFLENKSNFRKYKLFKNETITFYLTFDFFFMLPQCLHSCKSLMISNSNLVTFCLNDDSSFCFIEIFHQFFIGEIWTSRPPYKPDEVFLNYQT